MFRHFHLTKLQWKQILKWSLHSALFLAVLLVQTVVMAKNPIFGIKLCLIPTVLVCVCVREGPEGGGLFTLICAIVWCLSGADYGNLSIVTLTVFAVFSAALCRAALTDRLLPVWLCCFLTLLLNDSVIFIFKLVLTRIDARNFLRILLPGAALSSLFVFPIYPLVRVIHRTGGSHEL